jgi:adenylate kinase family enzyme
VKEVIAFTGRAGAGKSYQCRLLADKGFVKMSFADPLRQILSKTIGIPFNEFMDNYDKLKYTELINGLNARRLLENLGEGIRTYAPDYFIQALFSSVVKSDSSVCIDDLRYVNEYRFLRDRLCELQIPFKVVFCDYHSDRYQKYNTHGSAWLSNRLCDLGYADLQELTDDDIENLVDR